MSSNQDTDQKELPIPRTGIEVMNDLSLDARIVISLAYDDLLKPFIPAGATKQFFKLCMNSTYESPESRLSEWRYRKSDVEEFKLKHKDYLEGIRRDKANKLAESQKQCSPGSEHLRSIGKKGGEKPKKNRPILEAVIKYMMENPKMHGETNERIAKKFRNKYKENAPMSIIIDDTGWEVFSQGELICSRQARKHDRVKSNNDIKSIKYVTFWKSYISEAKKSSFTSEY
jgi:hypothetical protein